MVIKNSIVFFVIVTLSACSAKQTTITVVDEHRVFSETRSPASVEVNLDASELQAAREGKLGLVYRLGDTDSIIPGQLDSSDPDHPKMVMMLPEENNGAYEFGLHKQADTFGSMVNATVDPNGQILFEEDGKKVLQYNYHTVYEKDVIRLPGSETQKPSISRLGGVYLSEFLKENPRLPKDSAYTNLIYAVPRNDYVHPLYGLEGEMLTKDWPADGEFHHRGIFWAWPEVEMGAERGDIYALQRIFARPTEKVELVSGPVFAQVTAENLWKWGDSIPMVNEYVVIRAYRQTGSTRIIDFNIRLTALKDSITIATRLANSYGGFCVRMQTPQQQQISFYTDTAENKVRAWSDLSGIFQGNQSRSGLMILQHKDNPEYPGAWAHYDNLSWVQPTFPTPDTRYALKKGEPLVLRYRLVIHSNVAQDKDLAVKRWDAYNYTLTPLYHFKSN
ncbi:DUF6807 family protein [Agriterribacter sp.]|uniref:DUF6807 family protein n=1 Tax=Agriterribacter sp. TaxID=2821509 RepID=UPI002CB2ADC5|nr:DUF6807 family protein [Agriterribacter sp.]HRP54434.1 PmoA family protein [Agriterribacter sp.]